MELLIKAGGLLLLSCCAALLVKKTNPELSLVLSMAAVSVALLLSLGLLSSLRELRDTAERLYGVSPLYLLPILKCCAAALVARLTADLCREASALSAASAVEWIGTLCAFGAAMPLLLSMLNVIGEML